MPDAGRSRDETAAGRRLSLLPVGLRARLVTLVIAALAPFIVLIGFVARQHQINERADTQSTAKEVATEMAEHLDARIGTTELAILALKHAAFTSAADVAANDKLLSTFRADLPPRFAYFAIFDGAGRNIGSSEADSSGARAAFRSPTPAEPIPSGFSIAGPLFLLGDHGPSALAITYALDARGTRLVGYIPLASIQREVLRRDLPAGSGAALVGKDDAVIQSSRGILFSDRQRINGKGFTPPDSSAGVGILPGRDNSTLFAAYAAVQHAPFRIYVGTPEPLAFARARRDFWRAIGWGAIAFALGLILAWTQATRIIRPIQEIEADAAILGGGELGHRSRLSSSDEIGHLAKSLNTMAERLERREGEVLQTQKMESVGQLAGGIAHDFNNLLTVISGRLELLASSDELSPDAQEDVSEIRSATTRAVSLTRQLLAFSRKQLLRPRVVDLNAIVDELEPMLRRLIGEDVQIVIAREPGLQSVLADPGQIHQVLLNLCLNARDAMPAGGLLRIETRNEVVTEAAAGLSGAPPAGKYVLVSVKDSGEGMDEWTKARMFDPFFTTKAAGKGTGLGLATVYGIVKQSGGTITVDSEPGKGAVFRVYFPSSDASATGEFPVFTGDTRGTESVLIVEDERSVRDLATKILESRGYKVISASHGGDAMQIVAGSTRKIDLVLTDVVMPGMNGRELVDNIRVARPDIKVLYMSGYTDDEIVRRGLLDPSVDFIQKPFSSEELGRQVRKALDG